MSSAPLELWAPEERLDPAAFDAEALEFGAAKEGLARHVTSSLGRRAFAELSPLCDEAVGQLRTIQVELGDLEAGGDVLNLRGVTDPERILSSARDGGLEEEELASLRGFCGAVERLAHDRAHRLHRLPVLLGVVSVRHGRPPLPRRACSWTEL